MVDAAVPSALTAAAIVLGVPVLHRPLVTLALAVLPLVFVVWNTGIRQGRTGASLGKSVLGLRLVRAGSQAPVTVGPALLRQLCHLLEFGIGWLWPIWDARRQTFADKIVGTVVVALPGPAPADGGGRPAPR
jgi:uncharacterized RDD family membrane protein YckC